MTQQPIHRSVLFALLVCIVFIPVNVLLSVLVVGWRQIAPPDPSKRGDMGKAETRREPSNHLVSVMVLPFEINCLVGSPTEKAEESVRGIAKNLAIALERNTSLRVIGPDKLTAGDTKDAMKAGRSSGASAVLRGSVTMDVKSPWQGPKEKLTASMVLIEVETGFVLWEKSLVLIDNISPGKKEEGDLLLRLPRIQDEVVREFVGRWPRR